jgi:hypothetical protein
VLIQIPGDALKKLEERGVIIRFVIGRRFGSFSFLELTQWPLKPGIFDYYFFMN